MKKAKIYHAYPPNFDCRDIPDSNYQEIAEVVYEHDIVDDAQINIVLDYVYAVSQNVTDNWCNGIGVTPLNNREHSRSTSTGDVIEIDGGKYRCEWIGWKKIN
jgi:hypothetical protein